MDPFHPVDEPAARAARKAQFSRFHDESHPQLVALLHALRGDRAYAHRAAHRAFVQAWRHWPTVSALPDPAGWTRRKAREVRPPRHQPRPGVEEQETGWIAPSARPMFAALSQLPEQERTVVALHHVGGLAVEQVAEEEQLPLDVVMARLAAAYQVMAERLGWIPPGQRSHRTPDPSQPIHIWATVELTELAHALSYRTDRRALERVFGGATRQRLAVGGAVAAAVTIGLAGTLSLTKYPSVRYDVPLPPAGAPSEQTPPRLPSGGESTGAPPVPGPLFPPGLSTAGPPTVDQVDDDLVPTGSVTALDDSSPARSGSDGGGQSRATSSGSTGGSGSDRSGTNSGHYPSKPTQGNPKPSGGSSDGDDGDDGPSGGGTSGGGSSGGGGHSRGGGKHSAGGHSSDGGGHSGGGGHSRGGGRHSDGGGKHSGGGHSGGGGGHSRGGGHSGGGHGGGGGHSGGGGHGGGGHGGGGHGGGGHGH